MKPEKRHKGKPLAQVLHEESCAVSKCGLPWRHLRAVTKEKYARIAGAIELEVLKRLNK